MKGEKVLYLAVGDRVRQAREATKITQSELGDRIGLTRASVTNIEKARQNVQLHTLYAIARVLQVPVFALLPESEAPEAVGAAQDRLERVLAKAPALSGREREFVQSLLTSSAPKVASLGRELAEDNPLKRKR